MCDKIQHSNYGTAHEHQRALWKKRKISSKVYRCKECGHLHITSVKKKKR